MSRRQNSQATFTAYLDADEDTMEKLFGLHVELLESYSAEMRLLDVALVIPAQTGHS